MSYMETKVCSAQSQKILIPVKGTDQRTTSSPGPILFNCCGSSYYMEPSSLESLFSTNQYLAPEALRGLMQNPEWKRYPLEIRWIIAEHLLNIVQNPSGVNNYHWNILRSNLERILERSRITPLEAERLLEVACKERGHPDNKRTRELDEIDVNTMAPNKRGKTATLPNEWTVPMDF